MTFPSYVTHKRIANKERGFSIVELMIASAIGLMIVAGVSYVFLSSSQSRNELEKGSRQIENGRYAIEELRTDIQLAGFYGEYVPPPTSNARFTWTVPANPCSTIMQEMGFAVANYSWNIAVGGGIAKTLAPVALQGYTEGQGTPDCVSNRKPGTDILVVRRASTVVSNIDANQDGTAETAVAPGYHLQVSSCSDIPAENAFVMDHDATKFTLHNVRPAGALSSCLQGGLSTVRRYLVHIYYVSTCNNCSGAGDGIPTLKVVQLTPPASACATGAATSCGSMSAPRAIAEGIENLQLEYGLDSDANGTPDMFTAAAVDDANWEQVVAVKVFLLARNTEPTAGYNDNKKYSLNSAGTELLDAAGEALTPFNDNYKRHAYTATIMATNVAGRKLP